MTGDVLLIVVGLVILTAGAEGLVRGGAALALRLGITPLAVGLTVVAFGTSSPELVVSVSTALDGRGDLAVGNVVGSNIFNVLGILGVSSLVRPLDPGGVDTVDFAVMLVLAVALLPLLGTGFRLDRWEGALLLTAYVGYTAYLLVPVA